MSFSKDPKYTPEVSLSRNLKLGNITEDDAEIIRNYLNHLTVTNNISESRKSTLTSLICTLCSIEPHVRIRDLTKNEIYQKISNLKTGKYTNNTIRAFIQAGKAFWKYLITQGIINCDIADIELIKNQPIDFETTSPDEILTPSEIREMIRCANNSRDRAFIATLYESACRISEIASLKWKDVFPDEYGAKLYVYDHKCKKRRFCRLVSAAPYLNEWRNQYESFAPATGDNFVFVSLYRKQKTPLIYKTYIEILTKLAKKAGIKKHVHLHLMRKSRITHMVRENYNESIIKLIAWGNPNTHMMATYTRLSENDIDSEVLDHAGVVDRDGVMDTVKPHKCIRCGNIVAPDQKYCPHCGLSTDPTLINPEMSIHPELLAKILQIIQEQQKQDNSDNAGGKK